MKREWNQSADRLDSTALHVEKGMTIVSEQDRRNLINLKCLDELIKPTQDDQLVQITAITRSAAKRRHKPEVIQEEIMQKIGIRLIM